MSARDWRSVSHRSPCGVCKSTKRCGYTLDGRVRKCCYALDGGVGHGSDDVGDFALYFNDTVPGAIRKTFTPPADPPVADAGTCHAVYTALLAACGLSVEHRAQLTRRGLSDADITAAGYATLPRGGRERAAILATVAASFGGIPADVPGLHLGKLPDVDGILVPARDELGRITGVKVRRDRGEPRYLWLSSNGQGGAKARNAAHVPAAAREILSSATDQQAQVARLTEGELKADVATALSGVATLAVPGAMAARTALPALRALHVQVVRLSWDSDARANCHVAGGLERAAHLLSNELPGVAVEVETWATTADHSPKGIDDALAAGVALQVHQGPAAWRELVAILRASGREPRPETLVRAGMEAEDEVEPVAIVQPAKKRAAAAQPTTPTAPTTQAAQAAQVTDDWRANLSTTGRGAVKKGLANVCTILRHAPEWAGRLAWDEMSLTATLDGQPVGDVEATRLRERIERDWGFDPGGDAWAAILSVAAERPFHPVRDWLNSLRWDGVSRLDTVARDILGADDALSAVMIRKTFLGAVERARRPGCKVETCTVLIGPQGWRKSTFWRVLAGPAGQWFSDTHIDISNKDAYLQIGDAWIVELGEVEKITSRRGADEIKPFLSSVEDRYVPKYQRAVVRRKRGCAFVASTNQGQFLEDETGSRRYLCITLKQPADIERLRAIVEQLWAEAVALSDACDLPEEQRGPALWCLTPEEEGKRERAAGVHAVADTWTGAVLRWFKRQPEGQGYTTEQVLVGAIDLLLKDHTPMHTKRMAKVLRTLRCDYRQGRVLRDGRRDHRDYLWSLTDETLALDTEEGGQAGEGGQGAVVAASASTADAAGSEFVPMTFEGDDVWESGRE